MYYELLCALSLICYIVVRCYVTCISLNSVQLLFLLFTFFLCIYLCVYLFIFKLIFVFRIKMDLSDSKDINNVTK